MMLTTRWTRLPPTLGSYLVQGIPALKIYLAAVGAGAVEGSVRWWSREHRAHHRYTDTEKDPYSVRKGLLYSHIGWMVMRQNPKRIGRTDISDLNEDAVVVWQHRELPQDGHRHGAGLPHAGLRAALGRLDRRLRLRRHPAHLLHPAGHVLRQLAGPLAGRPAL